MSHHGPTASGPLGDEPSTLADPGDASSTSVEAAPLDEALVHEWIADHAEWQLRRAHPQGMFELARLYPCRDFAEAFSLASKVALLAERRNHHPKLVVSWGKLEVTWSTFDARGVTRLDIQAAMETDEAIATHRRTR